MSDNFIYCIVISKIYDEKINILLSVCISPYGLYRT